MSLIFAMTRDIFNLRLLHCCRIRTVVIAYAWLDPLVWFGGAAYQTKQKALRDKKFAHQSLKLWILRFLYSSRIGNAMAHELSKFIRKTITFVRISA